MSAGSQSRAPGPAASGRELTLLVCFDHGQSETFIMGRIGHQECFGIEGLQHLVVADASLDTDIPLEMMLCDVIHYVALIFVAVADNEKRGTLLSRNKFKGTDESQQVLATVDTTHVEDEVFGKGCRKHSR